MPIKTNAQNKDPKQSNNRVEITDFKGMGASQDPHGGDPAISAFQVNCYALHPGQLTVRAGMKLVTFLT